MRLGRVPAHLLALPGMHAPDGGAQLVGAERLDQELARTGEHRAAEVVRLALDAHHHDRRGGHRTTELLGRGDAVHARHVDVHQDDIRRQSCRGVDGLQAGRCDGDDLDVGLEREQLGEVFTRLGDIVDDDDPDGVSHAVAS